MLRFFSLLVRRPDVTAEEFHDHWRHPHGTMGRLIPGLRSYVQAHQVDTDLLGAGQDEVAGVAISSFDSAADASGLLSEPQYVDHVQPDEPAFQIPERSRFLSTDEEVLVARLRAQDGHAYGDALWDVLDRSVTIQLLQFVHLDGHASWAGDDDLELGRRLGAFRHTRNYPSPAVHGNTPPFLGARQLWWPTMSAFRAGAQSDPEAWQTLIGRAGHAITMLTRSERFLR
ncbi:hypothetical protein Aab01nite_64140 [Paractinoplanes abujensis]|uniref:EthD domain-containing protein n=1 Tax=Paractinoplanes abujensis TaxID=882441 RepID=A0A7W7CSR5_9ACTN|nr:EthD domain-containing protein [Actinoplanes abujensis]MBB4692675.1 hypothetical protein [Actinoplanes abujensis]GID22824.1 hypothetical protein Aab01nite_64140 [Actinoplanes abujensis]